MRWDDSGRFRIVDRAREKRLLLSILFWNLHKKAIVGLVAVIAAENNSDILILAECDDPYSILPSLDIHDGRRFAFTKSLDERFVVFSRLPDESLLALGVYQGLSFFRVSPPVGNDILLVAAHLPSKLWLSEGDQAFQSRLCIKKIAEYESRVGHSRTVLVGDLNMNPYESGMVSLDGFHATPARALAKREYRMTRGERYPYFYNPMWNHLGDDHGPPGTYYHDAPGPSHGHWHLLDQVIVRPSLLGALPGQRVRIITNAGPKSLLKRDGSIDTQVGSDHLPISFDLDLIKE